MRTRRLKTVGKNRSISFCYCKWQEVYKNDFFERVTAMGYTGDVKQLFKYLSEGDEKPSAAICASFIFAIGPAAYCAARLAATRKASYTVL